MGCVLAVTNGTRLALLPPHSSSKRPAVGLSESSEVYVTNRAAKILPGVVAGMLAGAAIATIQAGPVAAAEECLSKPKDGAPAGKHWYYRSDRATKRQCWYLGDEDAPARGASLSTRQTAAAAAARKHRSELSQAAADAHAELPSANDDVKPVTRSVAAASAPASVVAPSRAAPSAMPPSSMVPSPMASVPDSAPAPRAVDSSPFGDQSAISSRWPDRADAAAPAIPAPATSGNLVVADATPATAADSVGSGAEPTAMSMSDMTTAPEPSAVRPTDAGRAQLMAFLAAVAVAGFSTSVLLSRARRRRIPVEAVARRPRWPAEPQIDRMQLPSADRYPALARGDDHARQASRLSVVHEDEARYDDQYEIEDMLSRYAGHGRRD